MGVGMNDNQLDLTMIATREIIIKGGALDGTSLQFIQAETGPKLQEQLDRIEGMLTAIVKHLARVA